MLSWKAVAPIGKSFTHGASRFDERVDRYKGGHRILFMGAGAAGQRAAFLPVNGVPYAGTRVCWYRIFLTFLLSTYDTFVPNYVSN